MQPNQPVRADSEITTEASLNKTTDSGSPEFVSLSTGQHAQPTAARAPRFTAGKLTIAAVVLTILGLVGAVVYFMRTSTGSEQAQNVDNYPVSSLGLEKASTSLAVPSGASELAVNGDVTIAGILSLSDEAIANLGETLTNKVTIQDTFPGTPQAGNVGISGTFGAGNFVGSGAGITGLNATNITSGTLANARLSPDVSLLGQTIEAGEIQSNIVSSINGIVNDGGNVDIVAGTNVTVTTAGNTITISSLAAGGGIEEIIVGSGLVGGGTTATVNIDIDSSVVTLQGNTFNGAGQLVRLNGLGQLPAVNASQLTNLNASALTGGTVDDARLSSNVALKNGQNIFTPLADSTGVFRVQNAAANVDVLRVDTSNNRVGIGFGTAVAPNYTLDVNGDINIAAGSAFRIGGVAICTSGGCAAAAGSSDYIQNSASLQASANFFISSASTTDVTARIRGAVGQSANLLQLEDNSGTGVFSVGPGGNTIVRGTSLFRPGATTTALQVQNAAATVDVLRVDTQNGRIGIGYGVAVPPSYLLDVNGDVNIASSYAYRIGGTQICTSSGCLVAGGSGDYIQNGTAMQTANFAIQSASAGSIAARIRGAVGQTANILSVEDSNGNALLALSAQGNLAVQPTVNSTTAFRVFRDDGVTEALRVDTSANQTVVGDNGTTGTGALRVEASGTQNGLVVNSAGTGNLLNLSTASTSILISSTGQASFMNGVNSTTAFRIQDASSNTLLQVNTAQNQVNIGGGTLAAQLGVTTGGTQVGQIINNTGTANSLEIKKVSTNVFTVSDTGEVLVQPSANSSTALEIKNSSGANVLQVATGNSAANSTPSMTFNGSLIGDLASWTSNTNALPVEHNLSASVTLSGYTYILGGQQLGLPSSAVRYAVHRGDGSLGAWSSTTSLPVSGDTAAAATYNGFIYAAVNGASNIYYARPNNNGSISSWTTSSSTLPFQAYAPHHSMIIHNGYLYLVAMGANSRDIYYAKLGANGAPGAFTNISNALPSASLYPAVVVSNGYLVVMGGANGVLVKSDVHTFAINSSDGSLGAATATTSLPGPRTAGAAQVINGNIYYAGGVSDVAPVPRTEIFYTRLQANGTVASWSTSSTPLFESVYGAGSSSYNGYLYVFGGTKAGSATTDVNYMTSARVQLGGTLDLIGISNGTLAAGSGESGGSVYAGNISASGQLTVAGNTSLRGGATVGNLLQVQGDAAFRAASAASTETLQVQDSSGSVLFNVDAANRAVSVGTATATAALTVSSSAANNLFRVIDATTPTTVFNIADGGAATFRTQTNTSTALLIQNSAGTNQFAFDTANNRIYLGNAGSSFDLKLGGTGQVRNAITRDFTCTVTEQVNDIVVFSAASTVARTTTADSNRVAGVVIAKPSSTTCTTAIAGVVAVWFSSNATPGSVGDPVVTSAVSGAAQSTTTPAAGAMLGNSLSTKDGSNLVWVRLR
ncbi:MAG: Bulb-type lectin protein [Patescibacteria group bacterium]|nr:Bulb-type lectin protein [Patescibacteria group bacterium]